MPALVPLTLPGNEVAPSGTCDSTDDSVNPLRPDSAAASIGSNESGADGSSGVPPLLLRPQEAAGVLAIGRSTLYDLLRSGELPSVRIGCCRRIPAVALQQYVDQLLEQQR
jgi:excisionase family DNA binding protein